MNANENRRRGTNSAAAGTITGSEKTEMAPVVPNENHKERLMSQSVSIPARILDGTIHQYLVESGHILARGEIARDMRFLNAGGIGGLPTPFSGIFAGGMIWR
jgi:hypothetical protein